MNRYLLFISEWNQYVVYERLQLSDCRHIRHSSGGLLLLGLVVGGIYFVCVSNMRDNDKKRMHSGRNSASAWPVQVPSYSTPYREGRPTTTAVLGPATPVHSYDFPPQQPISQSPANVSQQQFAPQPHYSSQAPLVMPTRVEDLGPSGQYRPLQPNIIYTQGPSSYTQTIPVEYTIQPSLPTYHQSSV
ncbi:hypothetical protein KIN20_016814 [Parelaphostrongylus tenuis]|uniref:Uncharacterized protein n=1 Tax=Parelaphostrongylus tenuis TaxID=148309 RepID=A0AAD5MHW0_PARTN|nr:hypothetical protein KIN20_016814 [Parelaphostrongylus tenuis]